MENNLKQRNGCITAWLWVVILINMAMAIFYAVSMFEAYSTEMALGFGICSIFGVANVLGAILLMRWNKIGFYLFLFSSLICAVVNVCVLKMPPSVAVSSLFAIIIWWAILQAKKDGKSAWSQLESGWDYKHCRHLYQVFTVIGIALFVLTLIAVGKEHKTPYEDIDDDSYLDEGTMVKQEVVMDSVAETEKRSMPEQEMELDIVPAPYFSKDLRTFKLRGHVKKVKVYRGNYSHLEDYDHERPSEEFSFDKKGKLYFEDNWIKIIRNSNGRIYEIQYDLGGLRFVYDLNGETLGIYDVDTSTSLEKYMKWDKYGNPKESNLYGEDGDDGTPYAYFKYRYLRWDDKGNWILRQVDYSDGRDHSLWTQLREIAYY